MLKMSNLTLEREKFCMSADWSLTKGSRLALLGPSGAGKSTVLDAIGGFLDPASGTISWAGAPLPKGPTDRPVSMLFQAHNLFAHLTALQNATLGLTGRWRPTNAQKDRARAAMAQVGLTGFENRRPGDLSGGQQSRLALARVLLQDRPLLLLDEPFAALGPGLKADMLDLVAHVSKARRLTVLMVTHDPQDAARLCPLTSLVANGVSGPPQDTNVLLADPPPALAAYLGRRSK